uniref:Uncharacterized protein n=1 Tax=Globodera rostochiensis TaxID=31243 RepID=A0A914HIX6_GLORO
MPMTSATAIMTLFAVLNIFQLGEICVGMEGNDRVPTNEEDNAFNNSDKISTFSEDDFWSSVLAWDPLMEPEMEGEWMQSLPPVMNTDFFDQLPVTEWDSVGECIIPMDKTILHPMMAQDPPNETIFHPMVAPNPLNESMTHSMMAQDPPNETMIHPMMAQDPPNETIFHPMMAQDPPNETIFHPMMAQDPPNETIFHPMMAQDPPNETIFHPMVAPNPLNESMTHSMMAQDPPNETIFHPMMAQDLPNETIFHPMMAQRIFTRQNAWTTPMERKSVLIGHPTVSGLQSTIAKNSIAVNARVPEAPRTPMAGDHRLRLPQPLSMMALTDRHFTISDLFTVSTPEITVSRRVHTVPHKLGYFDGISSVEALLSNSKRPIETDDQLENGSRKMAKNDQTKNPISRNLEKLVKFVHRFFCLTLWVLDINLQSFDQLLEALKKGAKKGDLKIKSAFEHFAKMLRQMDVQKAIERFVKFTSVNKHFNGIIGEIQAQAAIVFGKSLFNVEKKTDAATYLTLLLGQQKIEFDDEKVEKRANLLFFFLRLYRKMVGLIEAPYKGAAHTEKLERSDREALLILISMTRKEMSTFFGRFLDINASEQQQMVLRRLATLDAFALIKEGISLAHFAVLHTIAPFLIREDIFQLKASCLFVLLEDISSKNIACLMLVNGKKVKNDNGIDLMAQIAKSAENHPKRQDIAVTFLRLFDETIRRNNANHSGQSNAARLIQNAQIYKELYAIVGKYLKTNETTIIGKYETLKNARDKLRTFLTKSVRQLDHLIKRWNSMKSPDNDQKSASVYEFFKV